jgi:N12 class adenine-specific DNA methylase
VISSGEKGKARDIMTAIRTLLKVESEQRPATPGERELLAKFAGFGPVALSIFPDPVTKRFKDSGWQSLGAELKSLLTEEEYDSAKRTTFNAFYTSPIVISAMHQALERMGVPQDALVLEPGAGTGNFLAYAPKGMRFIAVEKDNISGRIAKALHPAQDIRIEDFSQTRLPELDAVVGNVPFADVKYEHKGQRFATHDYFFAKSIDSLKPGGMMALVTSHYTLDKQNGAIREYLVERADFLGAIRLPSDAFKREGTAVITDIVFMRKRSLDDAPRHVEPAWMETQPTDIEGTTVPINRYFLAHPEMVLGTYSSKDSLYGGGYSVVSNGDLATQLQTAIQSLPEFAPIRVSATAEREPFTPPPQLPHISEGSFFVRDADRAICQVLERQAEPVVYGGTALKEGGTMTGKRLAALIGIRDRARRVLQSQNDGWPEANRIEARHELNRAYDRFVAAYGPINKTTFGESASEGSMIRRMPNLVKFREDPDAMLVMALEDYDELTGKARKAAIMEKDVVGNNPPVTKVSTAEEGLLVSLDQRGGIDLPFIRGLYGKPEEQIVAELGDLIFLDPESGHWETADAYLSGHVRAKLAAALKAGPVYARNAEALKAVQPEDVLPGDIDANLGAPWIPEDDLQAFAADLFGVSQRSVQIAHLKKDAVWSIEADSSAERSVAATVDYGTPRANAVWLLDLALNMKTPVIFDTVPGTDERALNQEATLAAKEKQKLIKDRFRTWLFADPDRTERLVRLYNDTYNNIRLRLFDGSHLDFPGMNQTVLLRAHQTAAVWRGMCAGNTLLAHVVGAGKTFTMATTGMKMKQAGLIKKPGYVVPNHMLEQFSREFLQLYPNAKLLVATKDDLGRDRRKFLTARIASGEWDGIIVTHSSFERIGMSKAYQEQFLREQIREYDQLLIESAGAKASKANRNLTKTIEKQKARRDARLQELLAEDKKDDGLVFDELGIDHLFIDEAHIFKNLETPTKMDRVAGIQTGGSERAFDLYMKARYLGMKRPGHGVTFATGTPISNTMVEMYTVQRFLDPEGLRERGIEHFDAWAATFGEVVETMEISPDGQSLKPRSRFAKFVNLPELQQMFRAFSDVQTAEMLGLPVPRLKGGKATIVACPMSEEQQTLQLELVARYDKLRSQKVDPRVDNALAITTDGRKLALDARMLSPSAPDFPGSKVNAMVDMVKADWQGSAPSRGTQLIFCDMGVHPTSWGYSAYDEIARKLITRGIPKEQIAAIGDADSDAKKQALFDKVRSGQVRVLIGSTAKMGTGTNVQKRLVALHHLDAPWKPAEVEQREGRILRQGNENEEVAIYRYVTQGSFDSYMWQALETKARFISQVITGDNSARQAEDIGAQELSYAEVKAIASGNPAVLTLAESDAEIQRLTMLKKNHADEQFLARRSLRDLPGMIESMNERLATLTADRETAAQHADAEVTIGGRSSSRSDAAGILAARLEALPETVRETRRLPLGVYRGLRFGMVLHPDFAPEAYLEGETIRHVSLSRENHGARAVLNALERLVGGYETQIANTQQEIAIAEGQLRDYRARFGSPFPHDSYLSELTSLRDQLKAGLSGGTTEPGAGTPAEVPVLAERIKTLRAGHTVEATPDRTQKRRVEAEQPVTARIRRRTAGIQAAGSGREPDEIASQAETALTPQDAGNRSPGDAETSLKPARPGWQR